MSDTAVQTAVMDYFHITREDLLSRTARDRARVIARHIAFYLEVELCARSFADIGRRYNRDHSTVLAAYNHMVERVALADDRYAKAIDAIKTLLEKTEPTIRQPQEILCPTCGSLVVQVLQKQIVALQLKVEYLSKITRSIECKTENDSLKSDKESLIDSESLTGT